MFGFHFWFPLLLLLLCPSGPSSGQLYAYENEVEEELAADEEADEITDSLPGVDFQLNFKHYSGFLQASPTHFLHYWFVTSQGDPAKDPVVFWFNGGPGCSSLDGLLNEMGPYVVQPDGRTLKQNPYSWNRYASVVYVEAPAGVGFSYASDGNITTNDDLTSSENYEAIKQFFAKHPSFRNHSVFITGESYGGVYVCAVCSVLSKACFITNFLFPVPTLTARIVDGQAEFPVNLKGIAIGNGYVNAQLNIDTSVRFAYGLEQQCCRGCIDGCDLTALSGQCGQMVEDIFEFLWHGGLNPYDLYRDCDPNPGRNSLKMEALQRGLVPSRMLHRFFSNSTRTLRRRLQQSVAGVGAPSVPCLNDTDMSTYMNAPEVRKALHIPASLGHWDICSEDITENYQKQYDDTAPFFKKILKAHVRVLLYYGDTDMACNFMLGQQFCSRLGLKLVLNKQPWKFARQVGGFKTLYAKGLTFLTVRGAGHMAPQWRAPQMDYVFSQFLLNHPI